MDSVKEMRKFLKSDRWEEWRHSDYDQKRKVPAPPVQKPAPEGAARIDLPAAASLPLGQTPLVEAMRRRRSHRSFTDKPLSLEELSFLLWATQGLNGDRPNFRVVPSGGARHPFETYLFINRVTGLEPGLYRYLAQEHQLCLLRSNPDMSAQVAEACNHDFAGNCAVTFLWSAIPYRTEWRYSFLSAKLIALDAGHVCQNLYLACEAIGAGTCALDAYDQNKLDAFLGLDGVDELAIYAAPVGKV